MVQLTVRILIAILPSVISLWTLQVSQRYLNYTHLNDRDCNLPHVTPDWGNGPGYISVDDIILRENNPDAYLQHQ